MPDVLFSYFRCHFKRCKKSREKLETTYTAQPEMLFKITRNSVCGSCLHDRRPESAAPSESKKENVTRKSSAA